MKNFSVRYLWRFCVLAVSLFCWLHALVISSDMVKSAKSVSMRYVTEGVSRAVVDNMLEEEDASFAVWRQTNGRTVEECEFSRNASVYVLEAAGDTELVIPLEELRYGFLPARGNTYTCAVDEATAYALWGGEDATGEILIYEKKEYIVTGIFARPENTLLLQSEPETNAVYPYLDLYASDGNGSLRQADEFRARYSLPEPEILRDNTETAKIMRQFALFPVLIVSVSLLWRILIRVAGAPGTFWGKTGFAAAVIAAVILTAWAVEFHPVFPLAAVPSRWSDFSFWSRLASDMYEQVTLERGFSWPSPDLLRWRQQWMLTLYSVGAVGGFAAASLRKYSKLT